MTFRILNDEARGQIAAHIFGAAPPGHPRAGSVSGTDAPTRSYEKPIYPPGGTPTYDPTGGGGGGGSGGGGGGGGGRCLVDINLPPGHPGTLPAKPNHDGKCPPDTGQVKYQLMNEGTPNPICCPSFIQTGTAGGGGTGGVKPPTGLPSITRCPSGTVNQMPPRVSVQGSPHFARNKSMCTGKGGSWTESPESPGYFFCCVPKDESEPPSGTGTGTGTITEDAFPGAWDGICSVASPIADIAAKSWGWAQINHALTLKTDDCTKDTGGGFTTTTYSSDASCSDIDVAIETVFAYNPGGATIARNTSVVVVRQFESSAQVTKAIIVVVPCST